MGHRHRQTPVSDICPAGREQGKFGSKRGCCSQQPLTTDAGPHFEALHGCCGSERCIPCARAFNMVAIATNG